MTPVSQTDKYTEIHRKLIHSEYIKVF